MHLAVRRTLVLALLVVGAGALPTTAMAGTARLVQYEDVRGGNTTTDQLFYAAAPGERNRVTVRVEGFAYVVTDSAGVTPGPGCARVGADRARCPRVGDGLGNGRLDLGDGDDSADVATGEAVPPNLYGGAGNDTLQGDPERTNLFVGGTGDDRMVGGNGPDIFDEGAAPSGADTMVGRGDGSDSVTYADRKGRVVADLDGAADDGQRGERDRIGRDIEGVVGGRGRDALTGNGGANTLIGSGGLDVLRGAAGKDTLYADGEFTSRGRTADRLYGGAGNDELTGNRGANLLDGGPGGDSFFAGPGADRIAARDGKRDTVRCGSGRDRGRADRRDRRSGCERLRLK